jgi:IrrE N-terminal-like domain
MTGKPRVARRSFAERCASKVLRELGIDGLPVDPEAIAVKHDIVVQPKPDAKPGVSGMLVKAGDNFGIMYATHIPSRGFQRFSIAHELGHYFIDGHAHQLLATGVHHSYAGFMSGDAFEQEADYFAAALLMPERPFRNEMDGHAPGLECVKQLARICETSLTATAIRYATTTRNGAAVILSSGSAIEYCFLSDGIKEAKGLSWLCKGTPLPTSSLTSEFNSRPENMRTAKREIGQGRLNDWMGGDQVYRIQEEVIGLAHYGRTLTVLTCKQLSVDIDQGEDDETEDQELVENWTRRFRR